MKIIDNIRNMQQLASFYNQTTNLVVSSVEKFFAPYGLFVQLESNTLQSGLPTKTFTVTFSSRVPTRSPFDHDAKAIYMDTRMRHKGFLLGELLFKPHLKSGSPPNEPTRTDYLLSCQVFLGKDLITTINIAVIIEEKNSYYAMVDENYDGVFDQDLRDYMSYGADIINKIVDVYYEDFFG